MTPLVPNRAAVSSEPGRLHAIVFGLHTIGSVVAGRIALRSAVLVGALVGWVIAEQSAVAQVALPGLSSPIPQMMPRPAPGVAPGLPPPAPVPRATEGGEILHDITGVSVEGVTAYENGQIAKYTEGLTGSGIQQDRIETARAGIVDLYRRDGYVYTVVNVIISKGVLRFVVIEGRIASVKLDGDIGPAGTQVLRFLNRLTEQRPIDTATLERWLLLAADVPGVTLRSTLAPSTEEPGALTLVAKVSRSWYSGLLTADNRAFPQTGPEQGLAVMDFNSFTEYGERTEVSLYSAFNATQIFGQAFTEFYIGGSGLKAKFYGGAGNSNPSGFLRQIGYEGISSIYGFQVSYPLVRVRQHSLNVFGSLDAIDTQTNFQQTPGGPITQNSNDQLRVLRAGGDYARLDTLLGAERAATNTANARFSQGLDGLGATSNSNPLASRLGEKVNFSKVNGEIGRNQSLMELWEDSSLALQLTAAGQYTGDVLPPVEEFYLGGPHFNRGYYWGQVTGDKALTATAELQLNTPIPVFGVVPWDVNAQFYAFYDWGETWQSRNSDANTILRSFGVGTRLYLTRDVELDLEGAYRMNRYPNGTGSGIAPLNAGVFYWGVLARF